MSLLNSPNPDLSAIAGSWSNENFKVKFIDEHEIQITKGILHLYPKFIEECKEEGVSTIYCEEFNLIKIHPDDNKINFGNITVNCEYLYLGDFTFYPKLFVENININTSYIYCKDDYGSLTQIDSNEVRITTTMHILGQDIFDKTFCKKKVPEYFPVINPKMVGVMSRYLPGTLDFCKPISEYPVHVENLHDILLGMPDCKYCFAMNFNTETHYNILVNKELSPVGQEQYFKLIAEDDRGYSFYWILPH